jgi:hypothetical protein
MTPEAWTKLVALAASLWEALKRAFPFLAGAYWQNLRQSYEDARLRALVERANRDEALKNIREFEAHKLDPDGNAEWLRERTARKL